MSPAVRVFLRLRKDLSRVGERFTSRIGAGDLSGTNNETYTHCTLLAGLRFSKPLTFPQVKKLSCRSLIVGTFSKPRRRRQRGSSKKKDLKSRTIAQLVCFQSVYISQPSSEKITTWNHQNLRSPRKETSTANYLSFHLELNAVLVAMLRLTCGTVRDVNHIHSFAIFQQQI